MIRLIQPRRMTAALAAALVPLTALAPIASAAAQTEPVAEAATPPDITEAVYGDLYAAMQEGLDQRQILESSLTALNREFAVNADFASAEAVSPGLIAEVIDGMRPILEGQSERMMARYRPATLSLFARYLTPDEARMIADFYRSDIGRKLMGGLSQSFSPDATLSSIQTETPVTSEQVQTDINMATSKVIGAMTEEELMEIGRIAIANPALLKLNSISTGVQELRAQMENEPLTAEEQAAVLAVVEDVFTRRLGGQ